MSQINLNTHTVMAFDFGTKSIGVAIGQDITRTARPITALKAKDGIPNWTQIEKLINEWKPILIIVGLPLNIDDTEQELTLRARKFGRRLRARFTIDVQFHDERLSTVEAKRHLFESGGYRALDKQHIDATSAMIILESWFEREENNNAL